MKKSHQKMAKKILSALAKGQEVQVALKRGITIIRVTGITVTKKLIMVYMNLDVPVRVQKVKKVIVIKKRRRKRAALG